MVSPLTSMAQDNSNAQFDRCSGERGATPCDWPAAE
jgi:hypothetical protein